MARASNIMPKRPREEYMREFAELRPSGGFSVILADPPWLFENWSAAGEDKNPMKHYPCMPTVDIMDLPVSALAAKNCALFMWGIWPLMPDWLPVINAWGFDYASLAWEWIKYNPETDKYAFGGGYGTRKNLEPCLLAIKGNPKMRKDADLSLFSIHEPAVGVHSVRDFIIQMPMNSIRAPLREHSRKPDEQYDRIETMFSGPKIELFSRSNRKGWKSWGRDAGLFDANAA